MWTISNENRLSAKVLRSRTISPPIFRIGVVFLMLGSSLAAQRPDPNRPAPPVGRDWGPSYSINGSMFDNQGRYLGPAVVSYPANADPLQKLEENARRDAAHAAEVRHRQQKHELAAPEPQVKADPEAPDQSELLKNSKDRDFILRNFRTMYVDARDAQYFGSDQMKAALGRNGGFNQLNIRIVDDPSVADVVLKVSYTFAWDYPFELRHQNTTIVLLAGKGQGPFSGPLGAADVARELVNAAKPYRVTAKPAK